MDRPLDLTVFVDYHCPYSYRVVDWLERLGPACVQPRYRFFPLEQVNRDPNAAEWRLWEQPLGYEHYRGRQGRCPLAAFLVTALLEARETAAVASAFRLAVYRARFDGRADITDMSLLVELARSAGADAGRLAADLADPDRLASARARIRDDWEAARTEYAIFGVPTLWLPGDTPIYLRLASHVPAGEEIGLLDSIVAFRRAAPGVLELKVPTAPTRSECDVGAPAARMPAKDPQATLPGGAPAFLACACRPGTWERRPAPS